MGGVEEAKRQSVRLIKLGVLVTVREFCLKIKSLIRFDPAFSNNITITTLIIKIIF